MKIKVDNVDYEEKENLLFKKQHKGQKWRVHINADNTIYRQRILTGVTEIHVSYATQTIGDVTWARTMFICNEGEISMSNNSIDSIVAIAE